MVKSVSLCKLLTVLFCVVSVTDKNDGSVEVVLVMSFYFICIPYAFSKFPAIISFI